MFNHYWPNFLNILFKPLNFTSFVYITHVNIAPDQLETLVSQSIEGFVCRRKGSPTLLARVGSLHGRATDFSGHCAMRCLPCRTLQEKRAIGSHKISLLLIEGYIDFWNQFFIVPNTSTIKWSNFANKPMCDYKQTLCSLILRSDV